MPTFEPLGEAALRVVFGTAIAPETLDAIHAFVRALDQRALPGIRDVVPAYAAVVIFFDHAVVAPEAVEAEARAAAEAADENPVPARTLVVPVCYGGDWGPDLADVAALHGLTDEAVIALHLAPTYRVAMLGFAPGFPYLAGLDARLATPRLATPRARVPAGSVGIAGAQTGLYPLDSPGGWRLIGQTPWRLFDPCAEAPFRFAPGDTVRFTRIDAATFEAMRAEEAPCA